MVEISFPVSAHASTSIMYDMCSAQRVKFSRARDAKLTEGSKVRKERGRGGVVGALFTGAQHGKRQIRRAMITYRSRMFDLS